MLKCPLCRLNYAECQLYFVSIMLSVNFAVLQTKPWWWMTLCWVSLCWVWLCWVSLCWMTWRLFNNCQQAVFKQVIDKWKMSDIFFLQFPPSSNKLEWLPLVGLIFFFSVFAKYPIGNITKGQCYTNTTIIYHGNLPW
jgi:hypothetical protein